MLAALGSRSSAAVFLIAISVVALKKSEKRYLAFGWFWFLGTMVPMLGLVQVGNQAMADRYAYLPTIGLFVIIVWATADWAACADNGPTQLMAVVGITVLLALAALTHIQLRYWHDDYTLWSHTPWPSRRTISWRRTIWLRP